MKVMVNGEERTLDEAATVAELVQDSAGSQNARGVAVAVNGEVVSRSRWPETVLSPDDRVEILRAVGGG